MKLVKVVSLMLFISIISFAQQENSVSHPFSKSVVITGEGGATIGGTDFPDIKPDYFGKGSLEYFFPTGSSSVFGIRLFGGGGYVSGKGLNSSSPLYTNINEVNTKIVFGGAGLVYSLSLGKVVQPYLFAGASYLIFDPLKTDGTKMPRYAAGEYANDEKNYMGEFGIRFLLSDRLSFNMGYTFNYIPNDNIDDIFSNEDDVFHFLFGGLSYYFISSNDQDGDGITDRKDLCEDTPLGVEVDEFGCPVDTDLDGVPDYLDLCPDTPAAVNVDENGCPYDSDNDGVYDYLDECPETPANKLVDEKGCEKITKEEMIKEEIETKKSVEEKLFLVLSGTANFKTGEANLLPNPKSGLDKLLQYMKENPQTNWVIEGHTDNKGSDEFNNLLSLNRAKSVLSYFMQNGIDKNRFEIIASGSKKPAADNSIEFGRALNRRVVIEEKNSYFERQALMRTIKFIEYDFENEFNIESLIFTDGKYFCIQVSSWKNRSKAEREVEKLVNSGHSAFFIASKNDKGEIYYRVRVGYFDNLEGTKNYLNYIR